MILVPVLEESEGLFHGLPLLLIDCSAGGIGK
jgi:hypothetical protein